MLNKPKTFFLTGSTGLVGSYFIYYFLKNGHKVFCLARSNNGCSAVERVEEKIKFWGEVDLNNLIVLDGDITREDFGLNAAEGFFVSEIDEVVHCAANTNFYDSYEQLKKVNVFGFEKLLNFFKRNNFRKRISFFSSLYVGWGSNQLFTEKTILKNKNFFSDYFKSKYEAEEIACERRKDKMWIDIYRVPAVLGESFSGKTFSFNQAFYRGLRVLDSQIFDTLPCRNVYLDVVFLDWLVEAYYAISCLISKRNVCYHLVSTTISAEDFVNQTCALLNISRPAITEATERYFASLSGIQKNLLKDNFLFAAHERKYSAKLTDSCLKALNFTSNFDINESFKNLVMYYKRFNMNKTQ